MNVFRQGCFAAAGLIGLASGHARGGEETIAPARLPAAVRQAAERAIPGVKWTEAYKETAGRSVTYEVEGVDREGDDVSVTVDAAGRVIEVCNEVDLAEVPRVVKDAFRVRMPGFKVREVMSVARDGAITGYSFESWKAGENHEVYISADGSQVQIED